MSSKLNGSYVIVIRLEQSPQGLRQLWTLPFRAFVELFFYTEEKTPVPSAEKILLDNPRGLLVGFLVTSSSVLTPPVMS